MTKSTKYISPYDEKKILVTNESGWRSVKVYAEGKTLFKSESPSNLRDGVKTEVDGVGTLELKLNKTLDVTLNGVIYKPQIVEKETEKVNNVSVIFWVLTGFSALGLAFMLMLGYNYLHSDLMKILVGLQIFTVLVYSATAILMKRGFYWFYYVGASVFTFFTVLEIIDIETKLQSAFALVIFIIRIVLLVLMLRIIPNIIRLMAASKSGDELENSVLDQ